MADHDKDITLMLGDLLNAGGAAGHSGSISMRRYRALNALLAERNALQQRVAELEAQPADRDLRYPSDAMVRWMDQVTAMLCHSMTHSHDAKQELVTRCDAAIAAMRKGESDAK